MIDTVNVAADGKPDLRFLAWKKVGELELTRGRHSLRFRTYSGPQHHGAIDAFVLTTEPFLPKGISRPGQAASARASGDSWPFLTERDDFRPDALLDLRSLNEAVAGIRGFIRLSPDKSGFVRGDGTPERFWAVNTYVQHDKSAGNLAHHARFLAKRGVNLVRLHGHLESHAKDPKLTDADPKTIDAAWKLVAAMKKEGIYTSISPYWSLELKHIPASWGVEGWPEDQSPLGLLFFNPRLQEGYKAWLKALLSPVNPYTGIPLARDPALAMIHLQNEDSLLFWTEQNIKGKQRELLGKQFGDWAKRKYGSTAAAGRAWGGEIMPEDDLSRGVLGIHMIWQLTQPQTGGLKRRLDDQLHFLAETMYNFNAEIAHYLREELGCRQLINAGNWRTADAVRLNDAERWSYTANEVLSVNTYYSPVHIGPDRVWRIDRGDQYEDGSVLLNPGAFPLDIKQVVGHPMMITETHWVPPTGYQSEGPFLAAAYQSLTGVDVVYWFTTNEVEWSDQDRADWDSASRAKWAIATPMMLGQFPAAALLFRRGYVEQGPPVVVEHRSLEQIWGRMPPIIAEDSGFDPSRDLGDTARRSNLARGVDPLAYLVGPVQVVYGSDPSRTKAMDLHRYIDRKSRLVSSDTGQLSWDYARGICILKAPSAQGATGFLDKAGDIALGDVTIRSQNDYASVLVVAMDGQPLGRSDRVLIQVGTRPTHRLVRSRSDVHRRWGQGDHPWPADRQHRHDALVDRRDEGPRPVEEFQAHLGDPARRQRQCQGDGPAPSRRGVDRARTTQGCPLRHPEGPIGHASNKVGHTPRRHHGQYHETISPCMDGNLRGDGDGRDGDRPAGFDGRHSRWPHRSRLLGCMEPGRQDDRHRRIRQHGPTVGRGHSQGGPQVRRALEAGPRRRRLAERQAGLVGEQRQYGEALGDPVGGTQTL